VPLHSACFRLKQAVPSGVTFASSTGRRLHSAQVQSIHASIMMQLSYLPPTHQKQVLTRQPMEAKHLQHRPVALASDVHAWQVAAAGP